MTVVRSSRSVAGPAPLVVVAAALLGLLLAACAGGADRDADGGAADGTADEVTEEDGAVDAATDDAATDDAATDDAATGDAATGDATPDVGDLEGHLDGDLLVAAASSLVPVIDDLVASFEADHDVEVVVDVGPSGQLAQRIVDGAPYDLFLSAGGGTVDRILDAGIGEASTRSAYALGHLAVWWSPERTGATGGWTDLPSIVDDPTVRAFAVADPEHAPYGAATQQALIAGGLLEALSDRIVDGDDVAGTQQLLASGAADVGVIARSLAIAADARGTGAWFDLDEALYRPFEQDLVVVTSDPQRAELAGRFVDLLTSEPGQQLLVRAGFDLPGPASGPSPRR